LIPAQQTAVEQVAATDWRQWQEATGGTLLDVREPLEWAQGTLPDSVTLSLSQLPTSLEVLDPERPVLVVCRAGNRSQLAAQFLAHNGFRQVANLAGGLKQVGLA
jgi:rhodanese-related sulfurtransferase